MSSTNLIRLKALRDVLTGLYPSDATAALTLYDTDGITPIAGASNIVMPYVAGTTGRASEYRGTLTATAAALLTAGLTYLLKVTVTDTVGDVHVFQNSCLAVAG